MKLMNAVQVMAAGSQHEDYPRRAARFLRHFFDPQQGGIGLSIPGFPSAYPSPAWALEDQGTIEQQEYSLRDALGYHRQALTLPQQVSRNEQLGVLLETLGRVVHHLQDMAQPAHTRNDAHQPGDGDIHEAYTEEHFVDEGRPIPATSPYPTPAVDLRTFDTARKFWINSGRGIAEFSSRNFVSMDTNFRLASSGFLPDVNHSLPVATGTTYVPLNQLGIGGSALGVTFIHSSIDDAYSGRSIPNERASTYSIFNSELERERLAGMIFTLNRFNFERNYQELMPRAIAYSAGLINYYFRGRFEIEQVSEEDALVTVVVRNVSEGEFSMRPDAQTAGFQLFYDARDGVRREIEFQQALPDSNWAFDETREFSFMRPTDVDTRNERAYLLVFDGIVGNERGLAAASFGGVEGGFLVTPKYPTSAAIQGSRTIVWREDAWRLDDDAGGQAGAIDWKGSRVGDVLSWGDGSGRYHPASGPTVYMNGRALARGPRDVYGSTIGASIRYVNGERTLNLVRGTIRGIRIYSRKFAHSYDNDELWSAANPLGWRLVHAGDHGPAYTGFFFNARGDEGQYITADVLDGGGPLRRVKVSLQGDRGFAVDYPAVATVVRGDRNFRHDTVDVNADAGVCVVRPGESSGEMVPSAGDSCGTTSYSGNRHNLQIISVTEQYTDKTLFCVDYRGNEEVFCTLEAPEDETVRSSTYDARIQQEYGSALYCAGRQVHDATVTETKRTNNNNARVLKIGSVEVPWTSEVSSTTRVRSYSGSFVTPRDYSGSINGSSSDRDRVTKLIQADARHDFAVYESSLSQLTGSYSGTFSADGPDEFPYTSTAVLTQRREVILLLGSQRQVLFEEETERETNRELESIRGSLPEGIGGCAPTPLQWDTASSTTHEDAEAASFQYSIMQGAGTYAIDRSGRLGLSQLIFFLNPNVIHGVRNVLTGGDLPTLFPGVPTADGYAYEIRLIR